MFLKSSVFHGRESRFSNEPCAWPRSPRHTKDSVTYSVPRGKKAWAILESSAVNWSPGQLMNKKIVILLQLFCLDRCLYDSFLSLQTDQSLVSWRPYLRRFVFQWYSAGGSRVCNSQKKVNPSLQTSLTFVSYLLTLVEFSVLSSP